MCGITGVYNYKNIRPVSEETVRKMTKTLIHRGPDEFSVHTNGPLGFGFTRLSIVDIAHGQQPMLSQDGRYTLIFNGEIYNYKTLRKQLSDKGYKFKTSSDTEVILALYEQGIKDPELKLKGMFAYALFDHVLEQLILSRDGVGKKPLFWTETENGILFGSEIKSILAAELFKPQANWDAISDFLTLSYIPQHHTAFHNVHHVQAGSRLVIGKDIKIEHWWQPPAYLESEKTESSDYQYDTYTYLKKSIKQRLTNDLPIGIFCSGGVDSAFILSMINEIGFPNKFIAYTVGFESADFDETRNARELVEHYGISHESIMMGAGDLLRVFNDVVYKSDNLIANPAIFANYMLSQHAQKKVKVALHGGGADELFFGYETYIADALAAKLRWLPNWSIKAAESLASFLPASHARLGFKYKLTKFLQGLYYSPEKQHYWWRTIFTEEDKDRLLNIPTDRVDSFYAYSKAFTECPSDSFMERAAYADRNVWWKAMGLYQGDAMSMANSLELRMPFMDKDLIEYLAKVPINEKFKNGKLKYLLKQICRKYQPAHVLNRPKQGFHIPLAEWFSGPLKPLICEMLSKEKLNKIPELNYDMINTVVQDHLSKKFDNSFKLINLIVLVQWYYTFILNEKQKIDK